MKIIITFLLISNYSFSQNINKEAKIYFDSANAIVYNSKNYEKAIHLLNKAINLDTAYINAYNNKVTFLMASHKLQEAKLTLNRLTIISANNKIYYMMIGVIFENSGDTISAFKNYNIAEIKYKLEQDTTSILKSDYEFLVLNRAMNLRFLRQDKYANEILTDYYEKVKTTKPQDWLVKALSADRKYYLDIFLYRNN